MKPNIWRAILGGFVGTVAITMMMYWIGPMMGMMKMDIAASLGSMLGGSWALGMMMHFHQRDDHLPAHLCLSAVPDFTGWSNAQRRRMGLDPVVPRTGNCDADDGRRVFQRQHGGHDGSRWFPGWPCHLWCAVRLDRRIG